MTRRAFETGAELVFAAGIWDYNQRSRRTFAACGYLPWGTLPEREGSRGESTVYLVCGRLRSPVAHHDPVQADCLFCGIAVAGRVAARIITEDELTVAMIDPRQPRKGHRLVMPKTHVESVFELDAAVGAAVMATVEGGAGGARRLQTGGPQPLAVQRSSCVAGGAAPSHAHPAEVARRRSPAGSIPLGHRCLTTANSMSNWVRFGRL